MGIRTEEWETTVDLYGTDLEILDARAVFRITVDESPAEPYSWGQDRGTEVSYDAHLLHILWNGEITYSREFVVKEFGESQVKKCEALAKERYEDEQTFG